MIGSPAQTILPGWVPMDGLPHLTDALDAGAVRCALMDQLGEDGVGLATGQITYLNHKPAVGALIGYQFERTGGGEPLRAAGRLVVPGRLDAVRMALESWASRHPGARVIHLRPWPLLVTLYPFDRRLPGLPVLGLRGKFKRHVEAMGIGIDRAESRVSGGRSARRLLTWKPGRRAVISADLVYLDAAGRCVGERGVVVKAYADNTGHRTHEWMTALHRTEELPEHLRLATPLAWDETRMILYQERLAGLPLLESTTAVEAARTAGRCLGGLHGISPMRVATGWLRPPRMAPDVLGQARAVSRHFSAICRSGGEGGSGPLAHRLEALVHRLARTIDGTESSSPDAPCLIHGDFHAGQLLVDGLRVGLIDLDEMCAGDPRIDLATFQAQLTARALAGFLPSGRAAEINGALRDGYQPASLDDRGQRWFDAAALALLALEPYRRRDPNWDETTSGILEAASARVAFTPRLKPTARRAHGSTAERLLDRPAALGLLNDAFASQGSATRLLEIRKGGLRVKNDRLEGSFDVIVEPTGPDDGPRLVTPLGVAMPAIGFTPGESMDLFLSPEDPLLPMSWIDFRETRSRLAALLGASEHEFRLVRHRHGSRAAWQVGTPGGGAPCIAVKLRRRAPRWIVSEVDDLVPWTLPLESPRRSNATAQGWIKGPALHERLMTGEATPAEMSRVGHLVGRFHREARLIPTGRTGLVNPRTLESEMESLSRQLSTLPIMPDELIEGVASRLDRLRTRPAGPVRPIAALHGDLHDRQILFVGDQPVVIDCDMASPGESELDVGNFMAHLMLRTVQLGGDPTLASPHIHDFRRAMENAALRPLDRDRLLAHVACTLLRLTLLYRLRIGGSRFGRALLDAHDAVGDLVT